MQIRVLPHRRRISINAMLAGHQCPMGLAFDPGRFALIPLDAFVAAKHCICQRLQGRARPCGILPYLPQGLDHQWQAHRWLVSQGLCGTIEYRNDFLKSNARFFQMSAETGILGGGFWTRTPSTPLQSPDRDRQKSAGEDRLFAHTRLLPLSPLQ